MKKDTKIQINVVRTVDWDMLENLFISACEGGSNYWIKSLTPLGKSSGDAYWDMTNGFTVKEPNMSGKYKIHKVTWSKVKKACQLFADQFPDRFSQCIAGFGDAEDADIFMQLCVFGKAIYG